MSSITLTLDFFRVNLEADAARLGTFEQILDGIMQRDPGERVVNYFGSPIRLDHGLWDETRELFTGIIHRLRMAEVPVISRPDGRREREVPLGQDEGLNEDTHFAYAPRSRCIILQRNWQNGVRYSTFARYFELILRTKAVELVPMVRDDPMRKVRRMRNLRSIDFKIVRPLGEVSADDAVGASMDQLHRADGEWLSVQLSAGRRKERGLNREYVLDLLSAWVAYPDAERVRVRGAEPGGQVELVDLLADRISVRKRVSSSGARVSRADVAAAIRDQYNASREEIERLFVY